MVKTCDVCGREMKLRMARKGPHAGNAFWGCSGYPKCKNIENTTPEDNVTEEQIDALQSSDSSNRGRMAAGSVISQLGMHPVAIDAHSTIFRKLRFGTHHEDSSLDVFDCRGGIHGRLTNAAIRNWGLEYRQTGGAILPDQTKVFVSVLDKHLHRGTEVLLNPEMESFILKNEESLETLFRGIDFDTFNADAEIFDSDEERAFWTMLENENPNLSSKLTPQVYIESILPEYQETGQRVDFFGLTDAGFTVIEIDGAQHGENRQHSLDQQRDDAFSRAGYLVKRIKTHELQSKTCDIPLISSNSPTRPEHLAHIVMVTVARAIKLNILKLDGKAWNLDIAGETNDELLDQFYLNALKGAISHLEQLAGLLGLSSALPETVNLTRNGTPISTLRGTDESNKNKHCLTIHFDRIPRGELQEGHFYFREFPTSLEVMMDVMDVAAISIQPDRDICKYFLRYFFRFEDFREGQWEGVARTLQGLDSLVLMPTGHGKSVIYQLASLLRPGTALIVDPIISLIDDQIDNLTNVGITRTVGISSQLSEPTKRKHIEQFSQGQFIFAFVAPERLQMVDFRNALRSVTSFTPVAAVVIDETHCVSEWGHDFRTSYLNLGRNCREFCASKNQVPPLLGLTGTASRSVLKDVKRELDIQDFDAVITPDSFDRKNLSFRVVTCDSSQKEYRLNGILQSLPGNFGFSFDDFYRPKRANTNSGLIFCPHVGGQYGVVSVASNIDTHLGIKTSFYSGKAPKGADSRSWNGIKRGVAQSFKSNEVPLMAATSAFGMGIDKPNVRYSIHLGIPSSIESFYQEAGRTGRDSKDSLCFVIASNDNPKRTAELLSSTRSIESVEKTVKDTSYGDSDDILRSLYFHTGSFKGLDSEVKEINRVLGIIGDVKGMADLSIKAGSGYDGLNRCEKAIHRMVVIGYIKDYTIDYSGKCVDIKLSGADADNLRSSLLGYVKNYQISRSNALEAKLDKSDLVTRDLVTHLATELLQFIYDTVELGRRRALLEMTLLCGKDATDESIRQRILAYLERSEFDEQLETIVDDIESQTLIPLILEEVASVNHAQSLRGQVARFLESYPDHPSLLLLRACIECMCRERDENVVTTSLENWARSAKEKYDLSLSTMAESYNYVMDIVSSRMPDTADLATKSILSTCNDASFVRHVLKRARSELEQKYALTVLLNISADRLPPIVEAIQRKAQ